MNRADRLRRLRAIGAARAARTAAIVERDDPAGLVDVLDEIAPGDAPAVIARRSQLATGGVQAARSRGRL